MLKVIFAFTMLTSLSAFADIEQFIIANLGKHKGHFENKPNGACEVEFNKPGTIENCGDGYCIKVAVSTRYSWLSYPNDGWTIDNNTVKFDYGWDEVRYWKFEFDQDSLKLKSAFKEDTRGKTPVCIFE